MTFCFTFIGNKLDSQAFSGPDEHHVEARVQSGNVGVFRRHNSITSLKGGWGGEAHLCAIAAR